MPLQRSAERTGSGRAAGYELIRSLPGRAKARSLQLIFVAFGILPAAGNGYLDREFPVLDRLIRAEIIEERK